jgi:hypothetical protein
MVAKYSSVNPGPTRTVFAVLRLLAPAGQGKMRRWILNGIRAKLPGIVGSMGYRFTKLPLFLAIPWQLHYMIRIILFRNYDLSRLELRSRGGF